MSECFRYDPSQRAELFVHMSSSWTEFIPPNPLPLPFGGSSVGFPSGQETIRRVSVTATTTIKSNANSKYAESNTYSCPQHMRTLKGCHTEGDERMKMEGNL